MNSLLVGAWEGGDETYHGLLLFTETHQLGLMVTKDRKPYKGDNPTETEELAAFRTLLTSGGTYSVSGSTLTLNQEYCKNEGEGTIYFAIAIEGDMLTISIDAVKWALKKVS